VNEQSECPYCGSKEFKECGMHIDNDGIIWVTLKCLNCRGIWDENRGKVNRNTKRYHIEVRRDRGKFVAFCDEYEYAVGTGPTKADAVASLMESIELHERLEEEETETLTEFLAKINWIEVLKKAIELRPTSWAERPVVEWRNASDTIFSALMIILREEGYDPSQIFLEVSE